MYNLMANCGQCANRSCTCSLVDGSNTDAVGNGSQYSPFAVTPVGFVPIPRPVGHISRTTNYTFTLTNTLEVITMDTNNLVVPFGSAEAGMTGALPSSRLTAVDAGKYLVGATVVFKVETFAGDVVRAAAILRGGSTSDVNTFARETRHLRNNNVEVTFITLVGMAELAVNDYIELYASTSGGGDIVISSYPGSPAQPCRATLWAQWMGL